MKAQLEITTESDNPSYKPGDHVRGRVSWQMESPPREAELRLFFHTSGKGSADVEIVAVVPFETPGPDENRSYELTLPDNPCSFSGKLLSLHWALELVIDDTQTERLDIIVSPTGEELDLYAHAADNPPEIASRKNRLRMGPPS